MSQIFEISKENSIRYSKVRLLNELKNDENTLSSDSLNQFSYIDIQRFLTKDIITTQFKSNYSTNIAKLTDSSGTTNLTVTKKTTNIGRTLRLDGHYYNYKDNGVYTGIYFTTGSYYTYNTTTPISTHILNGDLPEFAIIGQSVEIVGIGVYTIDRIIYDEDVDANVILITRTHSGVEVNSQIQSKYDLLPYEFYEFDTNFSDILDQCYITITVSDTYKRTLAAQSELIDIQLTHPKTLEIVYYNEINDDILYSTGIKHKIRPLYFQIVAVSENENEINITDTTSVLIDSNIDTKNKFFFRELSNEMMRKLKIALSSKVVIINNVGYIIDGTINDNYIENTNLYTLDATLNKTGINYYVDVTLDAALAYKTRVEALSGTIESFSCLLNDYDNNY